MPRKYRLTESFPKADTYMNVCLSVFKKQRKVSQVVTKNEGISVRADFHYWRACFREEQRKTDIALEIELKNFLGSMETLEAMQRRNRRQHMFLDACNGIVCRLYRLEGTEDYILAFAPRTETDDEFSRKWLAILRENYADQPQDVQDAIDNEFDGEDLDDEKDSNEK